MFLILCIALPVDPRILNSNSSRTDSSFMGSSTPLGLYLTTGHLTMPSSVTFPHQLLGSFISSSPIYILQQETYWVPRHLEESSWHEADGDPTAQTQSRTQQKWNPAQNWLMQGSTKLLKGSDFPLCIAMGCHRDGAQICSGTGFLDVQLSSSGDWQQQPLQLEVRIRQRNWPAPPPLKT